MITAATNQALFIYNGTSNQHLTRFSFANTAADRIVTWQDASGTVAFTGGTVSSLQGTEHQVLVNGTFGTPVTGTDIILTTPQDIDTTSSPTFLALTAGNLNLTGSTLSSVSANSNLNIVPNGSGKVCLLQADGLPGSSALVQMVKNGVSVGSLLGSFINTSAAAGLYFFKSRGATVASFTAVQNNDDLGSQHYFGTDGTDGFEAAGVYARVDGSVSAGIVPGKWQWYTSNTSGVLTLGMTLNAAQQLILANALTVPYGGSGLTSATAYALLAGGTTSTGAFQSLGTGSAGQLLQSNGAASLPSWTTASFPSGSGTLNHMLRSDGTNWVQTTATTLDASDNFAGIASISMSGTIIGATALQSATGLNLLSFNPQALAVNYLRITNNIAGNSPALGAVGADTDISLTLASKGAGLFSIVTAATATPILIYSGTTNQHLTRFAMSNTAADRTVTFQDASGTLAFTSDLTGFVTSVSGTTNRITSTGGTTPVIDISASYVGQSSITTLGTIGTGVWQGTVVGATYGGTGVNNGSNTLTLAGTLATVGAFASSFTMTGATSVTFPTSGTLATTAQLPSLGNYTFSANTMTVASGNMLFTPPGGNLGIQSAVDTNFNLVSTSATGQPYMQWTRDTSTAIAFIQAGTNITGNASSSGMLFVNNIAAGHYFFNISGTGNVLDLGPTTATFAGAISAPSINFGQTTLNNYTQNTFTPTVTCGTPGDLSVSYASQEGFYTRIGRMIQINYSVQFTPTFTTATGVITFGGLPVASAGNNSAFLISTMSNGWTWPVGKTMLVPNTNSSTTNVILQANGTAGQTSNVSIETTLVSGVQVSLTFSGVYYV